MSDDKHKVRVSLDVGANPPVTVNIETLTLKEKHKHKVVWKPASGTTDFTFHSLAIGGRTFTNPTSKGAPKGGGALSDIDVEDDKMTLEDKVGDAALDFPYIIKVESGGETYSSETATIKDEGGSPKIRNEP